jgi:drug/metabolite transporter (DMT)-like permease
VLAAASWGVGTVISKRAVAEIPPLTLLVVQLATSVVALWLATLVARTRAAVTAAGTPTTHPGALDRLGLLNPGASYALSLVGLSHITASLSVLLWAAEPILILGLAWWWLRERVTARLAGLSLGAAGGMALLVWAPGVAGQGFGIAMTLAGVGCCAVYTVMTRQRLGDAPSTLRVVLGQQLWALGLAVALLASSFVLVPGVGLAISIEAWLSALASGVVYYALAYGFYLAALRHVPASLAASAFYLIPVFGVVGGWLLLRERLDPAQWLGAAIVLAGVIGIARSNSNEVSGEAAAERASGS